MKKERRIKDFDELYKSLIDPEKKEEAKRKVERDKRKQEKIKDTGYE